MKNIKINCFVTLLFISFIWIALTLKHQYVREKSKSMLFLKFLYSIQPVSAKFYRIYPDYFHQTGYFSHRPKSTKSARSLKVWRSKRTGRKLRLHFYFVFYFLIYLSLFIAHFTFRYFTSMYTQFGSVLFFRK